MNKQYDYVYAVIRVDEYKGADCPIEPKVVVKEVVWDGDEADREVARLNALQKPNESLYFSQVTRLLPKTGPSSEETASESQNGQMQRRSEEVTHH